MRIIIKNNSEDTIFVFEWWYPYMCDVPDFVMNRLDPYYTINPGKVSITALNEGTSWESYFATGSIHGQDTIWIYVFNANKIDKKSDNVDSAFLARYGITLKDMIDLNWELSYPPDSILTVITNPDLAKDHSSY